MTRARLKPLPMLRLFRRFLGARGASVLTETALVLPVLVLLLLGGIEVSRMVMVTYKLQKATSTVSDLIARQPVVDEATLTGIFESIPHVMSPFTLGLNGVMMVSSVSGTGNGNMTVNWQRTGGGLLEAESTIGSPGGAAVLPDGIVLRDGVTAIASEVAYIYSPMWMPEMELVGPIRFTSIHRPREGGLTQVGS